MFSIDPLSGDISILDGSLLDFEDPDRIEYDLTVRVTDLEGLSVLISEQNLHFAKIVADRAIIIEGGTAKFDDTFAELEAHPDIRDMYLSV